MRSMSRPPSAPDQHQVVVVQALGNGFGVAGFVCGLLGAIFGVIVPVFGVPLCVLGVVFGAVGSRRANSDPARGRKGLSLAGTILGILGLILTVLWIVVFVAFSG